MCEQDVQLASGMLHESAHMVPASSAVYKGTALATPGACS